MSDKAGSILVANDLVALGGWFFERRWPFWQRKCLLNSVSLEIKQGELVAVMGLSGSGKSTLLRLLSGHGRAHSGEVRLKHLEDRYERRRGAALGYLHQDEFLPPELGVKSFLVSTGQTRDLEAEFKDIVKRVEEGMQEARLQQTLHSQPTGKLSGGEQRRVSLCAEMLSKPLFLFLDEPAANLDPYHSDLLHKLARRYADEGHGVAVVTHDLIEGAGFDKVVILKDGRIDFCGAPSEALQRYEADGWREVYEKLAAPEQLASRNKPQPQAEMTTPVPASVTLPAPSGVNAAALKGLRIHTKIMRQERVV